MTRNSPDRPTAGSARRILVVASTFPASKNDPVPSFVRDLVIAAKKHDPQLEFAVLAPHDPRSSTPGLTRHEHYDGYRFPYFWPRRAQLLAGQGGIVPSLQRNKALYLLVPFFLVAEWFAVKRLVRRFKPDVINAHWIIPQGVVVAFGRSRRIPIVLTIHGGDVFTFNNAITRRLKKFALRASARVIVNSSATKQRAEQLSPGVEAITIPMGVTPESFVSAPAKSHRKLRVLFVGRLSEEKGVSDLIEALAVLRERGVPVRARIAGTGPQGTELRGKAQSLGMKKKTVRFLGWVKRSNIAKHYAWADVFVGPSITAKTGWVEALGVVFIEAAASGLPVVTTDAGGMRDVVLSDTTGFIVPEQSPADIAAALERLAADPQLRLTFGAAGRDHVTDAFGWPSIARRYAELYRGV
jgi:glycosyltransferase involved in cell wall biosynthesis